MYTCYGLTGHVVDKCCKKFGFPIGYKNPASDVNVAVVTVNSFGSIAPYTSKGSATNAVHAASSSCYITQSLSVGFSL